jgi:ribosomal protein L40E
MTPDDDLALTRITALVAMDGPDLVARVPHEELCRLATARRELDAQPCRECSATPLPTSKPPASDAD